MPDLYFDGEVVAETRRTLAHASDLLGAPGRALAEVRADAVGVPELADRLHEFSGDWSYGIGQLASYAHSAVSELDQIASTFQSIDHKLASLLKGGH